jgi:RES domain-containing protein
MRRRSLVAKHPDSDALRGEIEKCARYAGAWEGPVFRFVMVAYSNRADLISGAGSRIHGARWNPPGLFNVVYGSLSAETAVTESLQTSNGFGIPPAKARPRVFAVLSLKLQLVLDLTATTTSAVLRKVLEEALEEDWKAAQDSGTESLSQATGRTAWECGFEAIIVPSAVAPPESNLALFPSRRRRGSSWKIQGVRDLPRSRER